jgi:lipid A disaccharide synthetase
VPELMQDAFTPAAVSAEVRRLLEDPAAREEMKADLAAVRASLGSGGAIERAADIFARMVSPRPGRATASEFLVS